MSTVQLGSPSDLNAYAVHLRRFLNATKGDDGLDDARTWAEATIRSQATDYK